MLCSKFFKPHDAKAAGWDQKLVARLDAIFNRIRHGYERRLRSSLSYLPVTLTFAALIIVSLYFLFNSARTELAPQEDQGVLISAITAAPDSTLQQRLMYDAKVYQILSSYGETDHVFQLDTPGSSIAGMVLKPWDERERKTNEMLPGMQADFNNIAGVRGGVFQPSPLPSSGNFPIEFDITSTQSAVRMNDVVQNFMQDAQKTGNFIYLDSNLKFDLPQATVEIDRDKTAQFGLTMTDVGNALSAMLGGGYVNYFTLDGRSYKVIPQVAQVSRLTTQQLDNYYIRTSSGTPIALSTLAHITTKTVPESLNHFQQLNSATISGMMFPGVAAGEALATLQELAKKDLPQGYGFDYGGQTRQMVQENAGFLLTIAFATILIFLTLAAQFESFRDPLIILISVPMSIAGALFFISLDSTDAGALKAMPHAVGWFMQFIGLGGIGKASINVYSKVGLLTLMGLISKHGILITEFANNLQKAGRSKQDAIIEAAAVRLRPILMTTAAMVLGVVPLLTATGAGALSRFNMGLVIATGLAVGTLFTLFVVPAMYMLLGADHHKK